MTNRSSVRGNLPAAAKRRCGGGLNESRRQRITVEHSLAPSFVGEKCSQESKKSAARLAVKPASSGETLTRLTQPVPPGTRRRSIYYDVCANIRPDAETRIEETHHEARTLLHRADDGPLACTYRLVGSHCHVRGIERIPERSRRRGARCHPDVRDRTGRSQPDVLHAGVLPGRPETDLSVRAAGSPDSRSNRSRLTRRCDWRTSTWHCPSCPSSAVGCSRPRTRRTATTSSIAST